MSRLTGDHLDEARAEWMELVDSFQEHDKMSKFATPMLIPLAAMGMRNLVFVDELITSSNLQEYLFPLQRAIQFVRTRDDSLIQKLSPEVRGAVTQIVADIERGLQEAKAEAKPPTKKTKRVPSRKAVRKRS
jgi:hypothetical protein